MDKVIDEWKLYEAGIEYNQAIINGDKSYYEQIDVNIDFANGNQWRNVEANDISKPMIPIIQKAKQHTVSNLTSTNISVTVNPLEMDSNDSEALQNDTEIINAEIRNILDQNKFEFKVREGLGDAFDTGDMCLHWYWNNQYEELNNKGRIECELVDGSNVMFGNANCPIVDKQPYIIVIGRDMVSNLQEEMKDNKAKGKVNEDIDYEYQAGDNGKVELKADKYGKALYIIVYKKKGNKIYATKCTKTAYIYENKDTGLSKYPIAWMNYKKQKNQYHGRAMVTGLIPNQIAINKLLAMIVYSVMKTAFPTMMYDENAMSEPTNEIGKAIPMRLRDGESISNKAAYLMVGQVSNQVVSVIEMIMNYTKDMLGINDAAVGNVNPDNAQAIALAEKLTSVPLENVRANLYEFVEQCVDIMIDFIGTFYGVRQVQLNVDDTYTVQEYDFSRIKNLILNKRVDVGAIGYASELSSLKELKGLLDTGKIETVEYLERLPEYTIPKIKELIDNIKYRTGYVEAKQAQEQNKQWESMAQFMETLPPEIQNKLKQLPDDQLEQQLAEMMKQAPNNQEANQQADINNMIRGEQFEQ